MVDISDAGNALFYGTTDGRVYEPDPAVTTFILYRGNPNHARLPVHLPAFYKLI
jgi:hypothetical protein